MANEQRKVNNIKLPIDELDLNHYLLREILGSNIIPWQPSQLVVLITVSKFIPLLIACVLIKTST